MTDIASLGLQVDASQTLAAVAALDKLTAAAGRAEDASGGVNQASKQTANTLNEASGAAQKAAASDKVLADILKQVSQATKDTATSNREIVDLLKQVGTTSNNTAAATRNLGTAHRNSAASFNVFGQTITANRMQMMEAEHVARSLFDVVVAGGNPLRALTLESGRVVQIMGEGSGGMAGSMAALSRLMPVLTGAAGFLGLAAAIAVAAKAADDYNKTQDELALSLMGVGRATGATVTQLEYLAQAHADTAKISVDAARAQEEAYIRAGISNTAVIGKLIDISREYALVTGETQAQANKELADSFADPIKGVDTMIEKVGGIDGATKQYIVELVRHNDLQDAQATLLGKVADRLQVAEDHVSALSKILNAGKNAWADYWREAGKEFNFELAALTPQGRKSEAFDSHIVESYQQYGQVPLKYYLPSAMRQMVRENQADEKAKLDGQDKVSLAGYAAFDQLKPTDDGRNRIRDELSAVKALYDQQKLLFSEGKISAQAWQDAGKRWTEAQTGAKQQLQRLDARDAGRKGPNISLADNTVTRQSDTALSSAQKSYLEAQISLTDSITSRADLQKLLAETEKQAALDQISAQRRAIAESHADSAARRAAYAKLDQAVQAIDQASIMRVAGIEAQARIDLQQRALDRRKTLTSLQDTTLSAMAQLAQTPQERAGYELQSLAARKALDDAQALLDHQARLAKAQAANPGSVPVVQDGYAAQQAERDKAYGLQVDAIAKQSEGPLAQWQDQVTQSAAQVRDSLEQVAVDGIGAFNQGLIGSIVYAKDWRSALLSVFQDVEAKFLNMELNKAEGALFGNAGNKGTGSDSVLSWLSSALSNSRPSQAHAVYYNDGGFTSFGGSDFSAGPLSFDGGGYTGYGPRSGGVDGKGGFPAILHPHETVVDHTKGQSIGAPIHLVQISADSSIVSQSWVDNVNAKLKAVHDSAVRLGSAKAVKNVKNNVGYYAHKWNQYKG